MDGPSARIVSFRRSLLCHVSVHPSIRAATWPGRQGPALIAQPAQIPRRAWLTIHVSHPSQSYDRV